MCYAAAREGHMVSVLSMVHVNNFTPLTSLLFTVSVTCFTLQFGEDCEYLHKLVFTSLPKDD